MEEKKTKETNQKTIGQMLSGGNSQNKKLVIKKKTIVKDSSTAPTEKKQQPKNPQAGQQPRQQEQKKSSTAGGQTEPNKVIKRPSQDRPSPIVGHLKNVKSQQEPVAEKVQENVSVDIKPTAVSEDIKPDTDSTKEQVKPITGSTVSLFQRIERNPIVSRPTKVYGQQGSTASTNQGDQRNFNRTNDKRNFKKPVGSGSGTNTGTFRRPMGQQGNNQQNQGTGNRSSNEFIPTNIPIDQTSGTTGLNQQNRKRSIQSSTFDKNKEKNNIKLQENAKFFKQAYKKTTTPVSTVPKEISIMENIQVGELAKKMNLKPGEVISKLMKMGMFVTINNIIDSDTAILFADEYGCKVKIVSLYEETVIQEEADVPERNIIRPPVVTIMGHVDHGKTRLLDTIRKSDIINTESGGITQHIGAYQVNTPNGIISFLDTPGHQAFTSMRARGASVTDIVVLVVAADDGVNTQTIEAINHAKEAEVPIIVAVNKIDLPAANPEKVRQELSNYGLQPEDWGGDTIYCHISAKQNIGVDKLLDMILLQAEVLELKANPNRKAKGTVIEAKLDPGRGPIATVLIQNGTLKIGDPFLAGVHAGKVRAMYDDLGKLVTIASPSFPVLVTGLDAVPQAGDPFDVLADEKEARQISQHRKEYERIGQAASITRVTLDNMNEIIQKGELKELKIIIKADFRGSAEAISESLAKLSSDQIKLTVIHAGTGAIIDSDVMLASASNAIIIGFHVRANPRTLILAEKENVQIKYYSIIYDIVNEVKAAMEGMLEPDKVEEKQGTVQVRDTFKISKVGTVAGCMVTSGKVFRNSFVRVFRDDIELFNGKIKSLKRVKDDAAEVATGFECGILLEGFDNIEVNDELEIYEIKTVNRKLL
jgi:translation initiation factor IF-2